MNVEDILRAHGVGTGGGTEVISSTTEPTTGLRDGLFWYNSTDQQIKMYAGGSFRELGGGSGSIVTKLTNDVTLTAGENSATIGIPGFKKSVDVLFVFQNGTHIEEGTHYNISTDGTTVTKVSGSWSNPTTLEFVALVTTQIPKMDSLQILELENDVQVTTNGTSNIVVGIPSYNPETDVLVTHQDNLQIFKDKEWTYDHYTNSINLIGYTVGTENSFHFTVKKKIRDNYDGMVDGSVDIINDTISNAKMGSDVKIGSLLSLQTTDKTSVTAAINEIQSEVNAAIPSSQKGVANGVATLDSNGKISSSQLSGLSLVAGDRHLIAQDPYTSIITSTGQTSPTFYVGFSGSVRVKAVVRAYTGYWVRAEVYKNGIKITEQTTPTASGGYQTYTLDFDVTISEDDAIQVKYYSNNTAPGTANADRQSLTLRTRNGPFISVV